MVGHDVVAVIVCLITPSLSLINHPPTPNRKLNLSLIAECSYIKVASELIFVCMTLVLKIFLVPKEFLGPKNIFGFEKVFGSKKIF